ncbi:MAG: cupin domain-containing protein [Planctomycetota bacterium]|nr:cupin domain-containing protein [Planctomycetota bacterium]
MSQIQVTQPADDELEKMGVRSWPIWTCDVSKFDWHYDQQETCYILAGKVTVTAGDEKVTFGPDDMVVFPEGLDCTWDVTEPVRKHYKFG